MRYESDSQKWGDCTAGEIQEILQFLRNAVDFVLDQNMKHLDKETEKLSKALMCAVSLGALPGP